MGGVGSHGSGNNRYTSRKHWHERFGKDVPFEWTDKHGEKHSLPYGAKFNIQKPIFRKPRRPNRVKKRETEGIAEFDVFDFLDEANDLVNTQKDIAKFEEQERIREYKNTERYKARRRAEQSEKRKNYYSNRNARRDNARIAAIPNDLQCPLCSIKKMKSKQWVSIEFRNGKHAICRVCFEKLRNKCKSELFREELKNFDYLFYVEWCIAYLKGLNNVT